jgi:hypothetical protein
MLPPYRLVSLSAALHYRIWPLDQGHWTIGRPGRRPNAVALEGSSVSRAHACLEIADKVELFAEAAGALTAVNGQRLEAGQRQELRPNDMIQIGDLLFRWERAETAPQQGEGTLRLGFLGRPSVVLAGAPESEVIFRNENARSLLFWLVACRGASLAVERITEEFWPERPDLRQRKNLSHILRAMQGELGWSADSFERWIDRRAETIALRPEAIEVCDLWTLQDAIRQSGPPRAMAELLSLHPGPLLPHARQRWAKALRDELFMGWLGLLNRCQPNDQELPRLGALLTACLRDGDFEEFVYLETFRLSARFGLSAMIALWLSELKDALRTMGDEPSQELLSQATRWSQSP